MLGEDRKSCHDGDGENDGDHDGEKTQRSVTPIVRPIQSYSKINVTKPRMTAC